MSKFVKIFALVATFGFLGNAFANDAVVDQKDVAATTETAVEAPKEVVKKAKTKKHVKKSEKKEEAKVEANANEAKEEIKKEEAAK